MHKNAKSDIDAYYELTLYTLEHARTDPSFIHQHIVDAYAASHIHENSKNITVAFALVGLYLYLKKNFTGREVQLAHIRMAKNKKSWPKFKTPQNMGSITVHDVLATEKNQNMEQMIKEWCKSVWNAWKDSHEEIALLVSKEILKYPKD